MGMSIHHIAIYTPNLKRLRDFYVTSFGGMAGSIYHNPARGFSSCFIRFDGDPTLELMTLQSGLSAQPVQPCAGYAHMAFNAGGRQGVDDLTNRLRQNGYIVTSGPRVTGDGCYESCVLDPDGNPVEITCD